MKDFKKKERNIKEIKMVSRKLNKIKKKSALSIPEPEEAFLYKT